MNQRNDFEKHLPQKIRDIHHKALQASARYKAAEVDLMNILDQVDLYRVYLRYGFNSLFQYAVHGLGLADNVAYTFINVTRKSREVPELKEEITKGALTVSKARKITAVINPENKNHWIELAKTAPQSKVEREVAKENPQEARKGRMDFVHPQNEIQEKVAIRQQPSVVRVQLQVGISEKLMMKIRRAQDLVGQKSKKPAGLEETLAALVDLYLEKYDPVEKAKRQMIRGKLAGGSHNTSPKDQNDSKQHENKNAGAQNQRDSKPNETRNGNGNGNGKSNHRSMTQSCPELVLRQVTEMPASKGSPKTTNLQDRKVDNGIVPLGRQGSSTGKREEIKNEVGSEKEEANPTTHGKREHDTTNGAKPLPMNKQIRRRPLPAATKHQVMLKFAGRCSHVNHQGERCRERRFLEIHHLTPVSLGGSNLLENLTLLCSGHHRAQHLKADISVN
ncbi:MAG: HNH endonuclease [Bdellovibrionaceae bacterium]|nr:HNH endonuclease [Pseudobdellovibrionaceae bacterium]